jgi:peptide/nickel transport system substrate-binding protein
MYEDDDVGEPVTAVRGPMLTRERLLQQIGATALGMSLGGLFVADALAQSSFEQLTQRASASEIPLMKWELAGSLPESVDITKAFGAPATISSLANSLEGLLVFDDLGTPRPHLARSFTRPDSRTYVYRIRQGVTFWDGSPLTAEDVVFSLNRNLLASTSLLSGYGSAVKSIKATGPSEVTIKLKQPDSDFRFLLGFAAGWIIQKRYAQKHNRDLGTPAALTMGTGPMKITRLVPGQSLTLERFDQYWGVKPKVKKIEFSSITDQATRILALRSGEIDGSVTLPLDRIRQWESISGVDLLSAPGHIVYFLFFDTDTPPFDDVHVRRAISHCVDRAGLLKAIAGGQGQIAPTIPDPPLWIGEGLSRKETARIFSHFRQYGFDLGKARAELSQSSVPDGFKTVFYAANNIPETTKIGLSLRENLRKIGITVDVKEIPFNSWLARYRGHKNYGIGLTYFATDYPGVLNNARLLLLSQYAVPNQYNFADYKNPKVDKLVKEAIATLDPVHGARVMAKALTIASQDAPYAPIYYQSTVSAMKSKYRFKGFSSWWYLQQWASRISAR